MKSKPKKRKTTKKPTAALARVEKTPLAPQSVAPSIEMAAKRIEEVRRFVQRNLNCEYQRYLTKHPKPPADERGRKDYYAKLKELEVDYGSIPGSKKKVLFQPGAEKICLWLRIEPKYETVEHPMEDGHVEIVVRTRLISTATKEELFEGPFCSCSTMESNYRYRFQKRDESIAPPDEKEKKKLKAMGLGYMKKMKDWDAQPPADRWFWFDRENNPNIHDTRNTVRQQAHKRSWVKATRNFGAMSEIFTEPPSDWTFEEEVEHTEEPVQKTPGGRVIVQQEAQPPQGTKAAAQAVAERIKAEHQAKAVAVDVPGKFPDGLRKTVVMQRPVIGVWYGKDRKVGFLKIPVLPEAETIILNRTMAEAKEICLSLAYWDDEKGFGVDARELRELLAICQKNGVELKELAESAASPTIGAPSQEAAEKSKDDGKHASETAPVIPSVAIISQVTRTKTKNKGVEVLNVHWGGVWLSCFKKTLWEYLESAQGKEAELIVSENKRNILGIHRIAGVTFDSEGLPEIQNQEDRATKTASLFK